MHGLMSLLDQEHETLVHSLWQELENTCGLTGVKITPFPHFSWLIAEDFDWDALDSNIAEIAGLIKPFTVQTTGISLFAGSNPTIYIPIVRSAELSAIHQLIWNKTAPTGKEVSPYYSPPKWVPHITIGFGDVTRENLPCALEKLAFRNFDWQIKVSSIAVGYQNPDETAVIQSHYEFQQ
jgi:2'-5' RNA ligase